MYLDSNGFMNKDILAVVQNRIIERNEHDPLHYVQSKCNQQKKMETVTLYSGQFHSNDG